jgi:hypothetical protein
MRQGRMMKMFSLLTGDTVAVVAFTQIVPACRTKMRAKRL